MIVALDADLKTLAENNANVTYVDCYSSFVGEDGYCKEGITFDGLHPNLDGYAIIAEILNPYLGEKAPITPSDDNPSDTDDNNSGKDDDNTSDTDDDNNSGKDEDNTSDENDDITSDNDNSNSEENSNTDSEPDNDAPSSSPSENEDKNNPVTGVASVVPAIAITSLAVVVLSRKHK